jgi:predicted dehydrogenase
MYPERMSRRRLLGGLAAGVMGPGLFSRAITSAQAQDKPRLKVERPGIGAIGLRYQGTVITHKALAHGDVVALCDVDRHVREQARASFGSTPRIFEDYRELLARPDVDVVMIGTPDHWHAKMLIDAVRAGKDVYCEKPLTLTIDEGKRIRQAIAQSDCVIQVGSWQRSDHRFRLAAEMVRQGRLGRLQRVEVVLGKNVVGGPFDVVPVPKHFNWDFWQGQTTDVPFLAERTHYTFRWWQEYSGGQMTDWGAHHIDIAQWAIDSYPIEVEGTAKFPPGGGDRFNVPLDYFARYRYANGVELTVADQGRNGILFIGSAGRIFVNRENLAGTPVSELAGKPLSREQFTLYGHDNLERPERAGKLDAIINHMGNFFDCIHSRRQPISDVESQHRSATTCHLGNMAMRLGRKLRWDPTSERFVDDAEADRQLRRDQRSGFEVA